MTTTSTQTFKKTPANFSFQRRLMTTDGAFYNQIAGAYEHIKVWTPRVLKCRRTRLNAEHAETRAIWA